MRKAKILINLFVIGLSFTAISAQEKTHRFNLDDALKYGLENSIAIRQAVLDQEGAAYKVGEVKSTGLPQITGEGQYQNFLNLPTQLLPGAIFGQEGTEIPVQFGTEFNASATLKASQLLYSQEFFTGLKAAKSSKELYMLMKINTEEEVIYQVSTSYYQALQLQAQISVLDSNLAMLNKLESLMKVQFENDIVTKNNYNRVKVNRSNLETQLQSLRTTAKQQNNYLKLLMGMSLNDELILLELKSLEDVSLSTLQYETVEPVQLSILSKQKNLYELSKNAISAGYFPTLAVFGQQAWQAQRNEFNFFDNHFPWYQQTLWGLSLQVPIFDGFQKHYKIQQSKIEINNMDLQILNAERQLDMQFKNAREQLVNSMASVQAQKENRELAKDVFDQTNDLYKEQVAGLTDLLDAEQAYRVAQTNYYNEILKFKKAELDLLKAQGQLKVISKK